MTGEQGERGRPGERGPTGDHGQTGDMGKTGRPGSVGDTGDTGRTGDTGPRGRMPPRIVFAFLAVVFTSCAVLFAVGWALVETRHQADENAKARIFLCAQRLNLQERLTASKDLDLDVLAQRLGVPAVLLRDSRQRDQTTLETMRILDCKENPK